MSTTTPAVDFDTVWDFFTQRWPHIALKDLNVTDGTDDSELGMAIDLATAVIHHEDLRQAPGSETALLGAALSDLNEASQGKQALLDVLTWWTDAYDAWDIEDSERIYDRIFDGDAAGALALARTDEVDA
jgi:hypothetical protein